MITLVNNKRNLYDVAIATRRIKLLKGRESLGAGYTLLDILDTKKGVFYMGDLKDASWHGKKIIFTPGTMIGIKVCANFAQIDYGTPGAIKMTKKFFLEILNSL